MNTPHGGIRLPQWLIAPVQPEETYRSILERVQERYGRVERFWQFSTAPTLPAPGAVSVDGMDQARVRRMAMHLGMPVAALYRHRLVDHDSLLAEPFRRLFCPRCWAEADAAGLPRIFRSAMQGIFVVACDRHPDELLREAAVPCERMGRARIDVGMYAEDADWVRHLTRWLAALARQLAASLCANAPWPDTWRGSTRECRIMISALCLEVTPDGAPCLLDAFRATLGDYGGHALAYEGRVNAPWDMLRVMASAATRRALLWAVLWYFAMPEDEATWPTWVCRGDRDSIKRGMPRRDDPTYYRSLEHLLATLSAANNPLVHARRQRDPLAMKGQRAGKEKFDEALRHLMQPPRRR